MYTIKIIIEPISNETVVNDVKVMCSPKKNPSVVIPVAQISDAIKKINDVIFVCVFASPATIGMNAFTEGISLPKKIYHMPRLIKVVCSALWIFKNVRSSIIRSFRANECSYFFTSKKVIIFPIVLPSVPAIIVGIKSKLPVLIKYPQTMYRS